MVTVMNELILGYCRVSTKKQVLHGFSLQSQRNEIAAYAFNSGKNVKYFADAGISGATIQQRSDLLRLINAIKNNDSITEVVVSRVDRLSRNVADVMKLNEFFQLHNVKLVSIHEPLVGNNDAESKMMTNVFASLAQFHRAIIEDNVRLSVANRYKLGKPLSSNVPLGYIYEETGRIVLDNEVAPLILNCFKYYASGNWGYRKLANWLSNKLNKPITLATIKNMLANNHYVGISSTAYGTSTGVYPQIVSRSLYERVQKQIASKRKPKKKSYKGDMLSGKIACPICGHYLGVNVVKRRNKEYRYYYCSVGVNRPLISNQHHTYRLNANSVKCRVRRSIIDTISRNGWQDSLIQSIDQFMVQPIKPAIQHKRSLSKEALYSRFEDGKISKEELKRGLKQITLVAESLAHKNTKEYQFEEVLEKFDQLEFEEFVHLIVKQVTMNLNKEIVEIKLAS